MSVPWFKNFMGLHQSDFELLRVPRPRLELSLHITLKSVQTGTLLGSLFVGPLQYLLKGGDYYSLQTAMVRGGCTGAKIGLLAGSVISLATVLQLSELGNYDRCYRFRFNRNQLLTDRASVVGGLLGYGLNGAAGFVIGVDFALLASTILTSFK